MIYHFKNPIIKLILYCISSKLIGSHTNISFIILKLSNKAVIKTSDIFFKLFLFLVISIKKLVNLPKT